VKTAYFVGTFVGISAIPEARTPTRRTRAVLVQVGPEPADFKPIPSVGAGAYEIRVQDEAGAFRVTTWQSLSTTVYALHAFQKKTRATAKAGSILRRGVTSSSENNHEKNQCAYHTG
jgi:phage-related protein